MIGALLRGPWLVLRAMLHLLRHGRPRDGQRPQLAGDPVLVCCSCGADALVHPDRVEPTATRFSGSTGWRRSSRSAALPRAAELAAHGVVDALYRGTIDVALVRGPVRRARPDRVLAAQPDGRDDAAPLLLRSLRTPRTAEHACAALHWGYCGALS